MTKKQTKQQQTNDKRRRAGRKPTPTLATAELVVGNNTAGWLLSDSAAPIRAIEKQHSVRLTVKGERTDAERAVVVSGRCSKRVAAAVAEIKAKAEASREARAHEPITRGLAIGEGAVAWLLSRGGTPIQELSSHFNVRLSVKGDRRDARRKVLVSGCREDVGAAVKELKVIEADFVAMVEEKQAALEAEELRISEAAIQRSARRQARLDAVDCTNWEAEDFALYWRYCQAQRVVLLDCEGDTDEVETVRKATQEEDAAREDEAAASEAQAAKAVDAAHQKAEIWQFAKEKVAEQELVLPKIVLLAPKVEDVAKVAKPKRTKVKAVAWLDFPTPA